MKVSPIEKIAIRMTRFVGSTTSLVLHTIFFTLCFMSVVFFGVPFEKMLLVLTTIVSLEAIYLSIFIQMSVNRSERRIARVSREVHEIAEDVVEIAEDVQGIETDIDEIQKDIEGIEEDVEDIAEDVEEIQKDIEEMEE